jgi:hypothetical protein
MAIMREESIYVTVFFQAAHDDVLMKLGSIWVAISMVRTIDIGAVLIQDILLKYPLIIR